MARYAYKAVDSTGKQKKGTIEANTAEAARQKLKQNGMNVQSVDEQKGSVGGRRVTDKDLSVFCKQFASVLRAGVPIIQALDMMSDTMTNKRLQAALGSCAAFVQKGGTLSNAFRQQPDIFPDMLSNMIEAGEASGKLEICFERMAVQFERAGHIQGKIKSAMMYPIVVLVVIAAVVTIMLVSVIPTFSEMFAEMDAKLPVATQMLVNFSDFLVHKWYILLVIIVAAVVVIKTFAKTPTGQDFFGGLALKLPIFGSLNLKSAAATFSRTFATLLASGISLIDAVEQTAKVIKNKVIRDKLLQCKVQVAKGVPLSKPIRDMEIFPSMLPSMMKIGEETGNIEDMMEKVADFYEDEVDLATDALSQALEPLIIVVMASIVGVIVIAIYSPILSMYDAVDSY